MSDLTRFRDHCRVMAASEHKPECPSLPKNQPHWSMWHGIYDASGEIEALGWNGPPPPPPTCDGCLTDAERDLFASMAAEVDDYLAPQPDLFGELTTEPTPDAHPASRESEQAAAGVVS